MVAIVMVINYIGVTLLINPHGWIKSQVSRTSGQILGVRLNFIAFGMNAIMNFFSINMLCKLGGWMFLVDVALAVVLLSFLHYLVPELLE